MNGVIPDLQVGQVWEDCDKRMSGRRLIISAVDRDRMVVLVNRHDTGRKTWIKMRRFQPNSTGYRLIKEKQ